MAETRRKKLLLKLSRKMEAIDMINRGKPLNEIADVYGVGLSTVSNWKKHQYEIQSYCSRLHHNQRKHVLDKRYTMKQPSDLTLDGALYIWYQEARDRGDHITGKVVQKKAKEINLRLTGVDNFSAAMGWVTRWKKRHGILGKFSTAELYRKVDESELLPLPAVEDGEDPLRLDLSSEEEMDDDSTSVDEEKPAKVREMSKEYPLSKEIPFKVDERFRRNPQIKNLDEILSKSKSQSFAPVVDLMDEDSRDRNGSGCDSDEGALVIDETDDLEVIKESNFFKGYSGNEPEIAEKMTDSPKILRETGNEQLPIRSSELVQDPDNTNQHSIEIPGRGPLLVTKLTDDEPFTTPEKSYMKGPAIPKYSSIYKRKLSPTNSNDKAILYKVLQDRVSDGKTSMVESSAPEFTNNESCNIQPLQISHSIQIPGHGPLVVAKLSESVMMDKTSHKKQTSQISGDFSSSTNKSFTTDNISRPISKESPLQISDNRTTMVDRSVPESTKKESNDLPSTPISHSIQIPGRGPLFVAKLTETVAKDKASNNIQPLQTSEDMSSSVNNSIITNNKSRTLPKESPLQISENENSMIYRSVPESTNNVSSNIQPITISHSIQIPGRAPLVVAKLSEPVATDKASPGTQPLQTSEGMSSSVNNSFITKIDNKNRLVPKELNLKISDNKTSMVNRSVPESTNKESNNLQPIPISHSIQLPGREPLVVAKLIESVATDKASHNTQPNKISDMSLSLNKSLITDSISNEVTYKSLQIRILDNKTSMDDRPFPDTTKDASGSILPNPISHSIQTPGCRSLITTKSTEQVVKSTVSHSTQTDQISGDKPLSKIKSFITNNTSKEESNKPLQIKILDNKNKLIAKSAPLMKCEALRELLSTPVSHSHMILGSGPLVKTKLPERNTDKVSHNSKTVQFSGDMPLLMEKPFKTENTSKTVAYKILPNQIAGNKTLIVESVPVSKNGAGCNLQTISKSIPKQKPGGGCSVTAKFPDLVTTDNVSHNSKPVKVSDETSSSMNKLFVTNSTSSAVSNNPLPFLILDNKSSMVDGFVPVSTNVASVNQQPIPISNSIKIPVGGQLVPGKVPDPIIIDKVFHNSHVQISVDTLSSMNKSFINDNASGAVSNKPLQFVILNNKSPMADKNVAVTTNETFCNSQPIPMSRSIQIPGSGPQVTRSPETTGTTDKGTNKSLIQFSGEMSSSMNKSFITENTSSAVSNKPLQFLILDNKTSMVNSVPGSTNAAWCNLQSIPISHSIQIPGSGPLVTKRLSDTTLTTNKVPNNSQPLQFSGDMSSSMNKSFRTDNINSAVSNNPLQFLILDNKTPMIDKSVPVSTNAAQCTLQSVSISHSIQRPGPLVPGKLPEPVTIDKVSHNLQPVQISGGTYSSMNTSIMPNSINKHLSYMAMPVQMSDNKTLIDRFEPVTINAPSCNLKSIPISHAIQIPGCGSLVTAKFLEHLTTGKGSHTLQPVQVSGDKSLLMNKSFITNNTSEAVTYKILPTQIADNKTSSVDTRLSFSGAKNDRSDHFQPICIPDTYQLSDLIPFPNQSHPSEYKTLNTSNISNLGSQNNSSSITHLNPNPDPIPISDDKTTSTNKLPEVNSVKKPVSLYQFPKHIIAQNQVTISRNSLKRPNEIKPKPWLSKTVKKEIKLPQSDPLKLQDKER